MLLFLNFHFVDLSKHLDVCVLSDMSIISFTHKIVLTLKKRVSLSPEHSTIPPLCFCSNVYRLIYFQARNKTRYKLQTQLENYQSGFINFAFNSLCSSVNIFSLTSTSVCFSFWLFVRPFNYFKAQDLVAYVCGNDLERLKNNQYNLLNIRTNTI